MKQAQGQSTHLHRHLDAQSPILITFDFTMKGEVHITKVQIDKFEFSARLLLSCFSREKKACPIYKCLYLHEQKTAYDAQFKTSSIKHLLNYKQNQKG